MDQAEQAFLNEIAVAPHALDRRLIYADWLEERLDPRADFIRNRQEMQSEKPWTERYDDLWRANRKLRDSIDSGWLRRMGYTALHQPMFTELPKDRASRWRLLKRFIEIWNRPVGDVNAVSPTVLDGIEYRLGSRLPAALREWYQICGYLDVGDGPTDPGDILTHVGSNLLSIWPGGRFGHYLIHKDEMTADPPVRNVTGEECFDSLTTFALHIVVRCVLDENQSIGAHRVYCERPKRLFQPEWTSADSRMCCNQFELHEGSDLIIESEWDGSVCRSTFYSLSASKTALANFEKIPSHDVGQRINGEWQFGEDSRIFVPGLSVHSEEPRAI